jgi:2-iminobutanoate/2-iminopropanoate deaminase
MRQAVATKSAPAAIGPYSQGIKSGGFLFTAGQVAFNPEDGTLIGGAIAEQTERVLKNIAAILAAGGSGMDKVVKTTVFLKNMSDFAGMNEVYEKFFKAPYPARSTVEVARLPKDVLVEIDAIALL